MNETLNAEIVRVRSAYLANRSRHLQKYTKQAGSIRSCPRWDGGEDPSSGKEFKPVWPKIIAAAGRENVDPVRLISAVFLYAVGPRPPEPLECCTEKALAYLKQTLKEGGDQIRGSLASNREVEYQVVAFSLPVGGASSQEELNLACRKAVGSVSAALSPIYRVCRAAQLSDKQLFSQYFQTALRQYVADQPVYDDVWGDFIPQELKDAAARYREAVGGQRS